jgi:pimeloyl-ACP methyl ester carboxylesterase
MTTARMHSALPSLRGFVKRKTFVIGCVATAAFARSQGEAAASEGEYDLTTPTGTLFGTLSMPAGATVAPVALIVAGSGPTDRNGNSPPLALEIYRKLANGLADRGIATVRYDKRGVGASGISAGPETSIRFETYIDDAVAWLQKLHADKRFANVSLIGHSEGSLVGMVAAQRSLLESYVSVEGAGFPAADVLRAQLVAQLSGSPDLLAQSQRILDQLVKGRAVADVPQTLSALFRPSVQPYLISWFKYDPRVELAKLPCRVTIVQGTHDLQVPVEDGKALAAVEGKSTFVLIDGMTHVLSDDPGTTMAEQVNGAYADSARPLDRRAVDAIATAIHG